MVNDSNSLDNEVRQKIIDPLQVELENLEANLSNKKISLDNADQSIQSKLCSYRASLKQSIDDYINFGKLLRYIFTCLLIFIGILFIGFDSTIGWIIGNNSFSNSSKILYLFSTVVLSVLLSVISVSCYNHWIVSKQKSVYKNEKYSIDSEKSNIEDFINGLKTSAQGTELFFRDKILMFGKINDVIRFKREWSLKCENLKKITTYFNLSELEKAIDNLGKNPKIDQIEKLDKDVEDYIITSICNEAAFNLTLMNLFVSYYKGNTDAVESYWETVRADNNLLDQIAGKLYFLKHFNVDENKLPLSIFQNILAKTQEFEQSLIMTNILLYSRIHDFLLNYRNKLLRENIHLKSGLTEEQIVSNLDFNNDFISNFIKIFSKELFQSIDIDLYKSLDTNFKKAYVDALIAIILNHDINFRKDVCINISSNDEAIYVLIAYHYLRKQKGARNEPFFLYDIFDKAKTPIEIKEKIDNDHYCKSFFSTIKSALSRGEWYESSQIITQKIAEEVMETLKKNDKNEQLIQIFAKYFTKININTIDRAVDAGLFTIYLILVPHTEGHFLTDVIDNLSVSIPKNHYIEKKDNSTRTFDDKTIKAFENNYKVALFFDSDTPMYDFKKYSNSTRIGIVHSKISFTTLVDRFNKDVEKVLRKKVEENPSEKWEKINFIVLRISPSKYSFGLMNDEISINGVKFSSNLDLANEIAELASPYLTEQQKTAVATFENDIRLESIFEQLSLFDFMPTNIQESYEKKYGSLLKSPDLMEEIKECLKSYDIESFRQLSARLSHHPEKENELKISLSSIITKEYNRNHKRQLNEDILDEFVSEFLDSTKALYELWNRDILNK